MSTRVVELSVRGPAVADGVVLTPAADVKPASVRWAWKGRIPLGAVTLHVGDPGRGKSTTAVELVARLSRGNLVGDLVGEPVTVALATAEDAIAQVIVPRLIAAGADLEHVVTIDVWRDGAAGGLVLPGDLPALQARIETAGVRVVVIDPWAAHLTETVNSHRDHDMRRALAPLARMAEELDIAVVVVAHLNKSEAAEVLHRVGGSIGLVAAARSVLLLGPDPADEDGPTRILAHAKCNVGPLMPSLRLRVESCALENHRDEDGRPIQTSRIAWLGDAEGVTAADLIAPKGGERRDVVAEAMEVLRRLLTSGPVAADDVERAREQAGIGERTWRKAKARLGVQSVKRGLAGGWAWQLSLPKADTRPIFLKRHPSASSKNDDAPPERTSSKDDEREIGTQRPSSAKPSERVPGEDDVEDGMPSSPCIEWRAAAMGAQLAAVPAGEPPPPLHVRPGAVPRRCPHPKSYPQAPLCHDCARLCPSCGEPSRFPGGRCDACFGAALQVLPLGEESPR